jgi:pimeloyl-ACP methyl ester carboxylesterase
MKYVLLSAIALLVSFTSCQKEVITIGTRVSETFYLDNRGASMRILVEGNTSSKVFILFVHGGPGAGGYIYDSDYIRKNIEDRYAMAYWDSRNAGGSQGSVNGHDLTLGQMADDLKKVIILIKARYGQNCSIFLLGHSFGGLLTSSFMVTGNNQSMVKGWIFADASHNYPLNDSLTQQMLLNTGEQEIALNHNRTQWEEIVAYCNANTGNFTYEESEQLESYAGEAETYFDEVIEFDIMKLVRENAVRYKWPLSSMLMNYLYTSEAGFNRVLAQTEFSSLLGKVTVPVLVLYGQYDFICPQELGADFYGRIGSTDKKMVISPVSGHSIMLQDEVLFCNEVNNFIDLHK